MEFPCRAFWCACGGRYAPSLHAWGILPYLASRYVRGRFIPTCVGNTSTARGNVSLAAVHPHVRGEYPRLYAALRRQVGSSPHAWGILEQHTTAQKCLRFIPTCVGNTSEDYLKAVQDGGSSPHAWGIHAHAGAARGLPRFIPTCVGNTGRSDGPCPAASVHPHMRGEYSFWPFRISAVFGSSPHAWGIPALWCKRAGMHRFIPTCVGNTNELKMRRPSSSVHPHMRGEYFFLGVFKVFRVGSSPHAWGIPFLLSDY